jgi:hypothetical protein
MNHIIYQDRHPRIFALLLTKTGFKGNPVVKHLFFYKLLKRLNDVVGAFDMAGTADTNT